MGRIKVSDLLVAVMRQNGEDWAGGARTSTSHNLLPPPPSSPALNVSGSRRRLATCLAGSSGQLWGRAGSIVGNSLLQVSWLPPQTRSCNFLGHFNISLRISMKPRFILFLGIGLSSGYFLYSSFVKPSYILGPLEFTTLYHPQLRMPIGDY